MPLFIKKQRPWHALNNTVLLSISAITKEKQRFKQSMQAFSVTSLDESCNQTACQSKNKNLNDDKDVK